MGQIVTFYSYKGGTGRSMALANVAWALASNRKKVLVIDWDLEAPGLHRYFRPFLADKELTEPESKGLIEFVRNYAMLAATPPAEGTRPERWYEGHAQIWKWATPLRWPRGPVLNFENQGEIQFVPAGRQGLDYAERINTFDWQALYQGHAGDRFFQSVREQAKREFDYVLIDSRTGVSDTSGICTIQMPDILVVCYTYNLQSIMGASDIASRVVEKRPGLAVFPVAMRVEFTETDSLIPMRKLARDRFGGLVTAANHAEYFDKAEVPYYPKYSFFERLAAFEEFPNAKGSINPDIRHLGFLITGKEIVQAPIEESRRRDVAQDFDPAPAKVMPKPTAPSPRLLPPRMKWAAAFSAVLLPLLIVLMVVSWRRAPKPEPVSVTVDPPGATLAEFDQLQLTATVHGAKDAGVIWSAALGKISSSGVYVAPATDAGQADTITATSTADRSQAGTAVFRITKRSHFVVNPVSATLKPGDVRDFKGMFGGELGETGRSSPADMIRWELSPPAGDLAVHGGNQVSYTAPKSLSKRQRVTLIGRVSAGEPAILASAGIELSPETSPLDRWAYAILAATAGALGGYLALLQMLGTSVGYAGFMNAEWWPYFWTRPLAGALSGGLVYLAAESISVPGQPLVGSVVNLMFLAVLAGWFSDRLLLKLQVITGLRTPVTRDTPR